MRSLGTSLQILRYTQVGGQCRASGALQLLCASRRAVAARSSPVGTPGLPLPLTERPAVGSNSLQQLVSWQAQQLRRIDSVGDALETLDNGPSASQLKVCKSGSIDFPDPEGCQACGAPAEIGMHVQTELAWLLEDVISDRDAQLALLQMDGPQRSLICEYEVPMRLSLEQLDALWARRFTGREPLQYLTNAAHWRDMLLAVGPGVLIPRPETELLVEFAEQAVKEQPALAGGVWADLGTGSGALAAAMARSRIIEPHQVFGVEQSTTAAAWARHNLQRLRITDKCQVVEGSWQTALPDKDGLVHGIVTNPPYIAASVIATLQAEVLHHEPHEALDGGGSDGLPLVESVCKASLRLLKPGGFLAVETGGPTQTQHLVRALAASFEAVEGRADLSGVVRFVTASCKL